MNKEIVPGKTLYNNPEDAFNAIVDSINEMDRRLEALTISYNEMLISNAAKFVALSKVLNFSTDEILDFHNFAKKEELRIKEQVENEVK